LAAPGAGGEARERVFSSSAPHRPPVYPPRGCGRRGSRWPSAASRTSERAAGAKRSPLATESGAGTCRQRGGTRYQRVRSLENPGPPGTRVGPRARSDPGKRVSRSTPGVMVVHAACRDPCLPRADPLVKRRLRGGDGCCSEDEWRGSPSARHCYCSWHESGSVRSRSDVDENSLASRSQLASD
jgi:hypothetical protein